MQPTKLAQIKEDQVAKAEAQARYENQLAITAKVSDTILAATESLIKFQQATTTKTEVVNPVTSVSTPDIDGVVKALQVVNGSIESQEPLDLSPLVTVLEGVLAETKAIPKDHKDIVIPDSITVTNQVDNTKQLKDLLTAIKGLKLTAEAPVVNVPAPNVNVDAPDLKPVETGLQSVTKAVKLSTDEIKEASSKSASALINEAFDEYRIVYKAKFDDSEDTMISGINYYYKNKKVAGLVYKYDKQGNLVSGKRA